MIENHNFSGYVIELQAELEVDWPSTLYKIQHHIYLLLRKTSNVEGKINKQMSKKRGRHGTKLVQNYFINFRQNI